MIGIGAVLAILGLRPGPGGDLTLVLWGAFVAAGGAWLGLPQVVHHLVWRLTHLQPKGERTQRRAGAERRAYASPVADSPRPADRPSADEPWRIYPHAEFDDEAPEGTWDAGNGASHGRRRSGRPGDGSA
ncbi:hypothetical protein GCM10028815_17440 [Mariniluteicoccus flavus]